MAKRSSQVQVMVIAANQMLKFNHVISIGHDMAFTTQYLLMACNQYKGFSWYYEDTHGVEHICTELEAIKYQGYIKFY